MKFLILTILTFGSFNLFAQDIQNQSIRAGIFFGKPTFKISVDSDLFAVEAEEEANLSSIYLGFQQVKKNRVAFAVALTYSSISFDETVFNNLMGEANATYGLGGRVHLFGGINISHYFSGNSDINESFKDLGIGGGIQLGAGFQILKNLALDLRYTLLLHTFETEVSEVRYTLSGLRVGALFSF